MRRSQSTKKPIAQLSGALETKAARGPDLNGRQPIDLSQPAKGATVAQNEAENIRLVCQSHLIKVIKKYRAYNDWGALLEDTRHREAERFLDIVQLRAINSFRLVCIGQV